MAYPFVLTVVEGPDVGQTFQLEPAHPARMLIGKSGACDVQLSDPAVSRRHAAAQVVGHRLRLCDLGSTNGTTVNGLAVMEAFLTGNELIHLGATTLRAERGPATQAAAAPHDTAFGSMIGASEAMQRLYPLCQRLAVADVPVIIEGETGVGKEQLAESIHHQGPRSRGPFVVLDCTAIAPNLIESELFGHERGAFTGSVGQHAGVFERAHGGTLFIDEIGDMPLPLQAKLLRAIERLEITRVGGTQLLKVDVRVLAATRRDLDREVQLGRFRDDLFHRMAVARIELPPLRERAGDVALLARHFWAEFGGDPQGLPSELLSSWQDYSWPGNVRELRNAVARRLALGDLGDSFPNGDEAAPPLAPTAGHPAAPRGDSIAAVLALDLPLADARQRIVGELEERYLERVLDAHGGNVTRAAAAAGVTRRQLQRLKARVGEPDS
jgi:DNA-binding NtrC family response regulator